MRTTMVGAFHRRCGRCHKIKNISEFYPQRGGSGWSSACKSCEAERKRVIKPEPVLSMSPVDLAWLAGLLEGEGCFMLTRLSKEQLGTYRYPLIRLGMVDQDVIERAHSLTGFGTVSHQYPPSHRARQVQPTWVWAVSRTKEALLLMRTLYPHMGARRREQIDAVLSTTIGHQSLSA